jgi:Ni/Fe-hydrogenase 1 B-type cytochrome subunit
MSFDSRETALELKAHHEVRPSVYVYEAPLRLWHWINALAITVLACTGLLISYPLPSVSGEASNAFLMGWVRFVHFSAGYILAVGLIGRLYWAAVGNHHARQIVTLPVWDRQWWRDMAYMAGWYLFLKKDARKFTGHNPLSHIAMVLVFGVALIVMVLTGFGLYAEGKGMGSWQHVVFGWVITLAGNTQTLHTLHHAGMWVLILFVMIHVYTAVREDIMSRQTLISTMVNGIRIFKDDKP